MLQSETSVETKCSRVTDFLALILTVSVAGRKTSAVPPLVTM